LNIGVKKADQALKLSIL